jgi:hypothetical protein
VLSNAQNCPNGPCQVSTQGTYTVQSTITTQGAQTITSSVGGSVGITAGVNFLGVTEVNAEFKYEISKAVQHATGKDVMNGNSTSVTNFVPLRLGNNGVATFIVWTI